MGETAPVRQHGESESEAPTPVHSEGHSSVPAIPGAARAAVILTLHLPASVDAVPRARHALRGAMSGESVDEPLQILELLVSELVTNAVRHAPQSTEVTVQLLCGDGVFRLAVADAGGPLRRPGRPARASDENGRGLLLVEALADSWGSYPIPGGKVVWCDVPAP